MRRSLAGRGMVGVRRAVRTDLGVERREGMPISRRGMLTFNLHAHRRRAWEVAPALQAMVSRFGDAKWASTEHRMHADGEILAGFTSGLTGLRLRALPGTLQMMV